MDSSHFSFLDIFVALIWFVILMFISSSKANKINNDSIRKYYTRNILFKFGFAILFSLVYLLYYSGGDTIAYWDGAITLNKLFFKSPVQYFEHLFSEPTAALKSLHFNVDTGYPPGWIYREPEAWFICKLASIVSFFTFRSYFAGTLIFAYFTARASWRVFEMVVKLKTHATKIAALCILFIPSVSFWCTGISKDTVIYFSILNLLYFSFDILILRNRMGIRHVIFLCISSFLIFHIRSFIFVTIAAPLFIAFGARLTKKYERNLFAKLAFRAFILFGGIFLFLYFFQSSFAESIVKEAQVVQQDFLQNPTYIGKRYEFSNTDASPIGLLQSLPLAVFYGIYRPFIYESFSVTLIMNGLESLLLMWFTVGFIFKGNVISKIKKIRKQEILVFAFVFSLFVAFVAGFTSVLFGVLVRIRAPLMPFVFLVLTSNVFKNKELENEKE
ncbi:MAG: hypothetical protein QNK70_02420 [Crocinitomicaceae bacterium]